MDSTIIDVEVARPKLVNRLSLAAQLRVSGNHVSLKVCPPHRGSLQLILNRCEQLEYVWLFCLRYHTHTYPLAAITAIDIPILIPRPTLVTETPRGPQEPGKEHLPVAVIERKWQKESRAV